VGRQRVKLDVHPSSDGEYVMLNGEFLRVLPAGDPSPPSRYATREPVHPRLMRYADHERTCKKNLRPDPDLIKTRPERPTRIRRM
jgi:hypothetical protein